MLRNQRKSWWTCSAKRARCLFPGSDRRAGRAWHRIHLQCASKWRLRYWASFAPRNLDGFYQICHIYDVMQTLVPTAEAARKVGISQRTLQRWIRGRKIKAPKTTLRNGRAVRLWSAKEINHVRDIKGRIYRRGRGRKGSRSHD